MDSQQKEIDRLKNELHDMEEYGDTYRDLYKKVREEIREVHHELKEVQEYRMETLRPHLEIALKVLEDAQRKGRAGLGETIKLFRSLK